MGIHADLPVPEAWQGVLGGLTPVASLPPARPFPSLGLLVDACLDLLPPDRARLLWARLGADQTLQEVGDAHGVTRERVRQVVNKLSSTFFNDPRLRLVIEGVFTGLSSEGALLVDLTGANSNLVPEALPVQLWHFVTELWRGVLGKQLHSVHLRDDLIVFAPDGLLAEKEVQRVMMECGSFLSPAQLAVRLNCPEEELVVLACASPKLKLTANGLYGFQDWTLPLLTKAVAEQLGSAGFCEWHFSEIGKAIAVFAPEWVGHPCRNFTAVLTRQNVTFFEHAGRGGYWRLKIFGDGYQDNREAIRVLLGAAELPMHVTEICEQLKRVIRPESVYALLDRAEEFRSFGGSIFGLANRKYPTNFPEDDLMCAAFGQAQTVCITLSQLPRFSMLADLNPERLMVLGRMSSTFRYWQRGRHEGVFLTIGEEQWRRFARWFTGRETRLLPEQAVLLAGLQQAFKAGDRRTIQLTALLLAQQSVDPPAEAVPWIEWATDSSALN